MSKHHGILFKPEMVEAIEAGRKFSTIRLDTPARRRIQPGDLLWVKHAPDGGNRMFARKADARLWLRVTDVTSCQLRWINNGRAVRDGFAGICGFLAYWRKLHGEVNYLENIIVIGFDRAEKPEELK